MSHKKKDTGRVVWLPVSNEHQVVKTNAPAPPEPAPAAPVKPPTKTIGEKKE